MGFNKTHRLFHEGDPDRETQTVEKNSGPSWSHHVGVFTPIGWGERIQFDLYAFFFQMGGKKPSIFGGWEKWWVSLP